MSTHILLHNSHIYIYYNIYIACWFEPHPIWITRFISFNYIIHAYHHVIVLQKITRLVWFKLAGIRSQKLLVILIFKLTRGDTKFYVKHAQVLYSMLYVVILYPCICRYILIICIVSGIAWKLEGSGSA